MEERIPRPGEFYLHFKKKLYQIITVATHTETGERMVVYQAMYGSFQTYVRPLKQFNSPVDKEKYPDCAQFYRFQKLTEEEVEALQPKEKLTAETEAQMEKEPETVTEVEKHAATFDVTEEETEIFEEKPTTPVSVDHTPGEEQADPRLMAFLDADTYDEKYRVLVAMGQDVDDRIINDLAVVLDVVIPEGNIDERLRQLKSCVETKRRYESNRLR
ncbi:MAG: DUF1653 domain-containing protein [Lachnospiraceae bacterium]